MLYLTFPIKSLLRIRISGSQNSTPEVVAKFPQTSLSREAAGRSLQRGEHGDFETSLADAMKRQLADSGFSGPMGIRPASAGGLGLSNTHPKPSLETVPEEKGGGEEDASDIDNRFEASGASRSCH